MKFLYKMSTNPRTEGEAVSVAHHTLSMKKKLIVFFCAAFLNGIAVSPAGTLAGDAGLFAGEDQTPGTVSPIAALVKVSKVRSPRLRSASAIVTDRTDGSILYEKNSRAVVPIASITKLMTAMVILDGTQSLDDPITITQEDVDRIRWSASRLPVGTTLSRGDLLRLALMASANRAAHALGRSYPGGMPDFIKAMNRKAGDLGLTATSFHDATGISARNVSSARDLASLAAAAAEYDLIREFSTTEKYSVVLKGRTQVFGNTNRLVRSPDWQIDVSKTGYILEAGKCLVMQAWISDRPLVIVLLDSYGKLTPMGDANRIRKWFERIAATHHI